MEREAGILIRLKNRGRMDIMDESLKSRFIVK